MTGLRKRIAQALVATVLVCAVGFMISGSMASPGNPWEQVCVGLMIVMLGSMFSALALVAATYIKLRRDVKNHLGRPPLSDSEFVTMLSDSADVDPELLDRIRGLAARHYRAIGGDRFYPTDRLEEDLHLRDLAPFARDRFLADVEIALGIKDDSLTAKLAEQPEPTFGDLIMIASSLAVMANQGLGLPDRYVGDPVWDLGPDE